MSRDRLGVTKSNILKAGKWLSHRRVVLFWLAAGFLLTVPWVIPGCGTASQPVPAVGDLKLGAVLEDCAVVSIHDGDTMTAHCGERIIKVRFYCIDAPELGQEPWGEQSRDHLSAIVGPTASLELKATDRYGRQVAVVRSLGKNLNYEQVRSGWAVVYRSYCDESTFDAQEREAQVSRLGVWAQPGAQQTPWAWRKQQH